ncbi:MAG TPA: NYN domain-containing protein [Pseudogracilibacillus sp.]|nr:NYN domain-containing protein [Pseudogracilibacillus sp.]
MDVLVVDGYNVIGAWDELNKMKQKNIGQARSRLIELLVEYQAYTRNRVIVVFDALYVKGNESRKIINNVEVIYTRENETADECIERLVKSLKNVKNQVYVATSDYLEQRTIFSRGALRISARELMIELQHMENMITEDLKQRNKERPKIKLHMQGNVREKFEKWRRGNFK